MAAHRARKPYSRPAPPRRNIDDAWVHDMADGAKNTPASRITNRQSQSTSSVPTATLAVNNLHYEITPKDLIAIFGQIGTLVGEPRIRYDRSGRSSGTAFVSFETVGEATRAKRQYDGILAKGQPMTIAFDAPPRSRSVSAPSTSTLLSRIQKPPLLDRLSKDDLNVKAPRGNGIGPIRNRGGRGKPPTAARPAKKVPKTAEDLDKELDAFMCDDATPSSTDAAPPSAPATQDVEMA
ncbi:RRM domain-containing protein [Mycena indigotica]|uniref:RRM domain-containing protein n=1 Tax=Mycena indigotica TaxID=2126181 RepID=A0A8H6WF63_9AGAR|nr:RRM domain-containing protein [Mycena indigotica]KAF7316439.1 RRM domain-containing protein [Mycena indigotica]